MGDVDLDLDAFDAMLERLPPHVLGARVRRLLQLADRQARQDLVRELVLAMRDTAQPELRVSLRRAYELIELPEPAERWART